MAIGTPETFETLSSPGGLLCPAFLEGRIALDVGASRPLPTAPEPGQPIPQIQEERISRLLAVVADVDPGFGLTSNAGAGGLPPSAGQLLDGRHACPGRGRCRAG